MTLTDFLIAIGQDPAKQLAYIEDPDGYIQDADISDEHKSLLRTGTDQAVMDEVANEGVNSTGGGNIKVTTLSPGNIKRVVELD
jgi:hypothetical protein